MTNPTNPATRLFSPKLYREALRQLRFPALLLGGIALILTLLIPIVTRIGSGPTAFATMAVSGLQLLSFSIALMYLLPLVLTWNLFRFGNARNASDYYHALPIKRSALFTTLVAAVITWIWVTCAVTLLAGSATYALLGATVPYSLLPGLVGFLFTAGLFATAGVALGMAITGTTFSNIVVSLLVLCLPRYVMACFSSMVASIVGNLPSAYVGLFNGRVTNTLFALPGAVMDSNMDRILSSGTNMLYTLVLAAIYLVVGCALFRHRRSESAQVSAPSRLLQHVYRIAITLPVLIALAMAIQSMLTPSSGDSSDIIITSIVFVVLSLIVFCAYELITTKSPRRLLRVLWTYVIVLALAGVFWGSASLTARNELRFTPAANDIAGVQVLDLSYRGSTADLLTSVIGYTDGLNSLDYNTLLLKELELDDPEILKLVAQHLLSETGKDPYMLENPTYDSDQSGLTTVLVRVRTNTGETKYRTLTIPQYISKLDPFIVALLQSPTAAEAMTALPDQGEVRTVTTDMYVMDAGTRTQTKEQLGRQLYDSFVQEYQTLSPEQQFRALYTQLGQSDESSPTVGSLNPVVLTVSGVRGLNSFECGYELGTYFPKTVQLYTRAQSEQLHDLLDEGSADAIGTIMGIMLWKTTDRLSTVNNEWRLEAATAVVEPASPSDPQEPGEPDGDEVAVSIQPTVSADVETPDEPVESDPQPTELFSAVWTDAYKTLTDFRGVDTDAGEPGKEYGITIQQYRQMLDVIKPALGRDLDLTLPYCLDLTGDVDIRSLFSDAGIPNTTITLTQAEGDALLRLVDGIAD
ncbi:MAG: ABC transporter permease [Actinomycetes bacterium]|jgi:hypothetical protein|nr:ABC transporter permease [Actinomycetes bacterium]